MRLLRRSREPFVSIAEVAGFAVAVITNVRSARRMIERNPDLFGSIGASGVRDEGAIWFLGEAAERLRIELGHGHQDRADASIALIPAKVFTMIAYRHPYFDANKRTAFLAASLTAFYLGFEIRPIPFDVVEEEVREMTAREAPDAEVAGWFLSKVFIPSEKKEGRE
jgi:prophage maintenance system killer protein